MVKIEEAEAKEARTIKSGYSWKTYASIETRTDKLDLFEQTDRRLFFELTGYKIDIEGHYEAIRDYSGNNLFSSDRINPAYKLEAQLKEDSINPT